MARRRNIHISLLRCKELEGVSLEAINLALRLPLVADDAGRLHVKFTEMAAQLYPGLDVAAELPGWYGELRSSGFLDGYRIGGHDYARLTRWKQDQYVMNPTPSRLPPSPNEQEEDSIDIESLRKLQGRSRKDVEQQDGSEVAPEIIETKIFSDSSIIESGAVDANRRATVEALDRIRGNAELKGKHNAAIRAVLEAARLLGVLPKRVAAADPARPVKAAAAGGTEEGAPDDLLREPAPHERFGLPATNEKV